MPSDSRKPCDQCFRRKVRCDYETPCNRCRDTQLTCTHSIVRKKRGPRKGRGAILDHLRSNSDAQDRQSASVDNHESYSVASDTNGHISNPSSPELRRRGQSYTSIEPATANAPQSLAAAPLSEILNATQQSSYTSVPAPQPVPISDNYDFPHASVFDDNFLTFDEFTQTVLADNSYFSYEPAPNVLGETPNLPAVTPMGSGSYETPQTAIATTIALPTDFGGFEITPIVERAVELFFLHMYPTYPILSQEIVSTWLHSPNLLSRSEQVLLWSICAATLVMVDDWPNLGNEQRAVSARKFVRKCRQSRVEWDYQEEAEYYDAVASLFIANTFFELKCRRASWHFVREAINLSIIAGLHEDKGYINIDEEEQIRRRRAYALFFITERGAAILDSFPVSIFNPPPLPSAALPREDPTIIAGLGALHSLFCLLDVKFVKLWNTHMQASFGESGYTDLILLQNHLRELQIERSVLSEIQRADVLITQQWLRLVFWQAALRLGYISTAADDRSFTYEYPVDIAMALCDVVKSLPPVAIQVHGLGIFEKQFEVAYSLMDTLALSGTTQPEHHECLRYLLLSLSASPSSRQIYVKTLEKKMGASQKYRSLAGVQLLRDDATSRQNSRRQSVTVGGQR